LVALKTADQLLKKNPNHGDTEAMKALVINHLGNADEGKCEDDDEGNA
jgi:hypothetical protein